jgi:hypothetical protein
VSTLSQRAADEHFPGEVTAQLPTMSVTDDKVRAPPPVAASRWLDWTLGRHVLARAAHAFSFDRRR